MTPSTSIVEQFLSGRAMPEQWLGLFVLVAVGVVAFLALARQHVRDTRDESRGRR